MSDQAGRKAKLILKSLALAIMLELEQIERQDKDRTYVNIRLPKDAAKELVDIILEI